MQDFKSELWNFACVAHYNHICSKWMILAKLDLAVAKVTIDKNVSSAIIYWYYMYESWPKIGCNIILHWCLDMLIYTVLANTEVFNQEFWGTYMEHTPGHVWSMDQKKLFKNVMYWCGWIYNNALEPYKKWKLLCLKDLLSIIINLYLPTPIHHIPR